MIQAEIFKILSESPAITAIVSSRIYPIKLPQDSPVPAIVYTIEDIAPIVTLTGEAGVDNGTIEIVCWAKDYTTAHLLASAVRSAFVASYSNITTLNMQDIDDDDTHNYGVLINMAALI
jgi:hypothetical protein